MRKVLIRLNFIWDYEDDIQTFILFVPDNISNEEVEKEILHVHEYLCFENEEDIYGVCGRTPGTLINYMCEKHDDWDYMDMEYDIDFNLL